MEHRRAPSLTFGGEVMDGFPEEALSRLRTKGCTEDRLSFLDGEIW